MYLEIPAKKHESKAIEFVKHFEYNDFKRHNLNDLCDYLNSSTYDKWLDSMNKREIIINTVNGKAPVLTYFFMDVETDDIIGIVKIKLVSNFFLDGECSNIHILLRPDVNDRKHATSILKESIKIFNTMGVYEISVNCDETDLIMDSAILSCGGVLQDKIKSVFDNRTILKYKIFMGIFNVLY